MPESSSVIRDAPPRVGVSACLIGQNTRYDGSNKFDPVVVEIVGAIVELVPVCPEMAIGMGAPRPPIRLVNGPDGLRARGVDDPAVDVTDALTEAGGSRTGLSGFVSKSRSPSCGAGDADIFSPGGGIASSSGYGVFARSLMEATPLLPVEDEAAMRDAERRNAFLLRVFVYDEWMRAAGGGVEAFRAFVEKTGFARNALEGGARRDIDRLAGLAQKDGGLEACGKYAAAFLKALQNARSGSPAREAADRAVILLALRKNAAQTA